MKTPRTIWIAGNWKMNLSPSEVEGFFSEWAGLLNESASQWKGKSGWVAALAPAALSADRAVQAARNVTVPVRVGAQNVHWEKKGAFTGEVSAPMAKDLGLSFALVGHSERRQFFGESHEWVQRKIRALLEGGLTPLVCVGETRAERDAGKTQAVLEEQLRGALGAPTSEHARALDGRVVIAYEPVWAIGTGLTATPTQAEEVHAWIRDFLNREYGAVSAERTSILYGGSVTPENIEALLSCANIDGVLVGGASLKPSSYHALFLAGVRCAEKRTAFV